MFSRTSQSRWLEPVECPTLLTTLQGSWGKCKCGMRSSRTPFLLWGYEHQCRLSPKACAQPRWWVQSQQSGLLCSFPISPHEDPSSYISGRELRPMQKAAQANKKAYMPRSQSKRPSCRPAWWRAGPGFSDWGRKTSLWPASPLPCMGQVLQEHREQERGGCRFPPAREIGRRRIPGIQPCVSSDL